MNEAQRSVLSSLMLQRLANTPQEPFEPSPYYDRDGDCVEFIAAPGPFYAERVDEFVTVYRHQETDEVVGSLIKQVSRFCGTISQRFPALRVVVEDGRCGWTTCFW